MSRPVTCVSSGSAKEAPILLPMYTGVILKLAGRSRPGSEKKRQRITELLILLYEVYMYYKLAVLHQLLLLRRLMLKAGMLLAEPSSWAQMNQ